MPENENRESIDESTSKDPTTKDETAPGQAEAPASASAPQAPAAADEPTPAQDAAAPAPEAEAPASASAEAAPPAAEPVAAEPAAEPAAAAAPPEGADAAAGGEAAEAADSAEGGKKKKKRRRRKKKKGAAEGEAKPKKEQAFSRFFEGAGPRQHAFRAGEVVAGRVSRVRDGAITVDLFGKATAIADVLEPRDIPEPPAPEEPSLDAAAETPAEAAPSAEPAAEATPEAAASAEPAAEATPEAAASAEPATEATPEAAASAEPAAEATPEAAASAEPAAEATPEEPSAPVEVSAATPTAAATAQAEPSATTEGGEESPPAAAESAEAGEAKAEAATEPKVEETIEPAPLEPEGPHPEPPEVGAIFRGRVGAVAESGHIAIVNRNIERPRAKAALRLAHEEKRRVPGLVFGYNRGGFDVLVAGIRCFAPARGMSLTRIEDPEELIGRKLEFTVPKSKGGKSIVVTRRSLLEKEARQAAKARLDELKVGETLEGTVTDVRDYGALVDIGGIDGLVHMSEIAWTRGGKPSDHVKPGDQVKVEVLKVQKMSRKDRYGKVSLSIRKCLPDPWKEHEELLQLGKPRKGKVVSLTDFGAFLELAPGIEGLLHISELEGKPAHAKDVLEEGQELDVVIDRKDEEQRRLSLSLLTKADLEAIEKGELDLSAAPRSTKVGSIVTVVVERTEHHGLLVQVKGLIGKRGRGYVPNRELPESGDRKKRFAPGTEHDLKVIGTDRDGRLRLSVKGKERDEERKAVRDYRKEAASKGFGTFGDLLKSKLDK